MTIGGETWRKLGSLDLSQGKRFEITKVMRCNPVYTYLDKYYITIQIDKDIDG